MATGAADHNSRDEAQDAVTLHRIVRSMIGEELGSHYKTPQRLSHELFVLLMQLNEQERKRKTRTVPAKTRVKRAVGEKV